MNSAERRKLIIKLVKTGCKNRRVYVDSATARDFGMLIEPTRSDVEDELDHMQGFRSNVKQSAAEEMFYGVESSMESTEE